ncbi:MAG: hypothetical protein PHE38_12305 [Alishewanella agri]|nr:hypothetical protein [Alishewanella agri]
MAGDARTTNFMLGTAEVMIGPRDKMHELNPEQHSLGLVKNFNAEAQKENTDLGQGVQNVTIFTRTTGITSRASCEVYEYTAKNLAYALSLEGSQFQPITGTVRKLTAASVNGADKTHTLTADSPVDAQALVIGGYVTLREPQNNNITLAKIQQITPALIVEVDVGTKIFPVGTEVQACHVLAVGSSAESEEFAAKIVGQLADGTWVTLLYPRIRITSGMSMAFQTDNYGNMPFEFTPMRLVAGDKYFDEMNGRLANLVLNGAKSAITG